MLKKLFIAAALAAPGLAFAAPEIVIRINSPERVQHDYVEYQRHDYRHDRNEQRQLIHWVDEEQERQRERVIQGVRSGELTPHEAHRLQEEQAGIRALEQRYLSDRHFSQREFDSIQDELRDSSRHILAQKTDRQDRNDNRGHGHQDRDDNQRYGRR